MTLPFLAYYISISTGKDFLSVIKDLPKKMISANTNALAVWKLVGTVCFVTNIFSLVIAFQISRVANAVFLHSSGIVVVALLSGVLLREHLSRHDWIAIALAFTGIFLLSFDGIQLNAVNGTLLGLLACITMAGNQLSFGKIRAHAQTGYEVFEMLLLADFLVVIIGLPAVFIAAPPQPSHIAWLLIILLGIVPWGIPNILYLMAVKEPKKVPIFRALILTGFDPVLTALWPALFIKQVPTITAAMGATLVIAAMIYHELTRRRHSTFMHTTETDIV
jgi:drug/metabolite transporter (DMT)-like permease